MTYATVDSFVFKTAEEDGMDRQPFHHVDHTPYDDDIPKEFHAREPAPPPYDIDPDVQQVNNDWAMDLIAWALAEIGW